MAGYRNRLITLRFPELAEEGDDIHVVMRNPKLLPMAELQSLAGSGGTDPGRLEEARKRLEETGDAGDLLTGEDATRGFAFVARLVIGWRVYDATSLDDDQPLLGLPATPELIERLPQEILLRIMDEVGQANPREAQASREATGNPS